MGELMSKKLVKPILNGILFLGVFLFAHTYLKNVSFTRYLLVVIPMLLVGIFGIDLILSLLIKKKNNKRTSYFDKMFFSFHNHLMLQ